MQKVNFSCLQLKQQFQFQHITVAETSIARRDTKENASTRSDSSKLSAPGKKKCECWSVSRTKTLAYLQKEYFPDLQTSKQHLIWIEIKTAVKEKGPVKRLKQLKGKIRNVKDAYKAVCDNYKKNGASPTYSLYFEDFDEVLGTRGLRNTTFTREVGALNQDDISHDEGKDNLILCRIFSLKAEKGVQS